MSRRKAAPTPSTQLSLFDLLQAIERPAPKGPGSLAWGLRIREALSEILRRCPKSRHLIAAEMSELTGEEITKTRLDSWTAESREDHRFPAQYLPALAYVTGDASLLRELARSVDLMVIESREMLIHQLGEISERKKVLQEEERQIRAVLRRLEGPP